jgi:hypothetical protein
LANSSLPRGQAEQNRARLLPTVSPPSFNPHRSLDSPGPDRNSRVIQKRLSMSAPEVLKQTRYVLANEKRTSAQKVPQKRSPQNRSKSVPKMLQKCFPRAPKIPPLECPKSATLCSECSTHASPSAPKVPPERLKNAQRLKQEHFLSTLYLRQPTPFVGIRGLQPQACLTSHPTLPRRRFSPAPWTCKQRYSSTRTCNHALL